MLSCMYIYNDELCTHPNLLYTLPQSWSPLSSVAIIIMDGLLSIMNMSSCENYVHVIFIIYLTVLCL